MKKINILKYTLALAAMATFVSCSDLLDREPVSDIDPNLYLQSSEQMRAYLMPLYETLENAAVKNSLTGEKMYATVDEKTDNGLPANATMPDEFDDNQYQVKQSGNSAWDFKNIYKTNYFINIVQKKFDDKELSWTVNTKEVNMLGEAYFFRAYYYFDKLMYVGDYPIVTETLTVDKEELIKQSERAPRNEVARFIISDLDKAIAYIPEVSMDGGRRNLLSKNVARLFQSRVALYEASWLKNFDGTAFVPGGPDWPGAAMDYNKGKDPYAESGSLAEEVKYFAKIAMDAADAVASKVDLTPNNGIVAPNVWLPGVDDGDEMCGSTDKRAKTIDYVTKYNDNLAKILKEQGYDQLYIDAIGQGFSNRPVTADVSDLNAGWMTGEGLTPKGDGDYLENPSRYIPTPYGSDNPYYAMFMMEDLSSYGEVLLWRQYDNNLLGYINAATGKTMRSTTSGVVSHQFVRTCLRQDGTPRYDGAPDIIPQIEGDILAIGIGMDPRLRLFISRPGGLALTRNVTNVYVNYIFDVAPLMYNSQTAYASRKGMMDDYDNMGNTQSEAGCCMFRAAEAYLNYVEADLILNGGTQLTGANSAKYWNAIRYRAGLTTDYQTTVNALDLDKEAEYDWAVYSGGKQVSALEYALRKERRVEFLMEGLRYMDLRRWRSFDQLVVGNDANNNYPFKSIKGLAIHVSDKDDKGKDFTNVLTGEKLEKLPNQELYENFRYGAAEFNDDGTNAAYGWDLLDFKGRVPTKHDPKKQTASKTAKGSISGPEKGMCNYPYSEKVAIAAGEIHWHMAHYLRPIEIEHMLITSPDGTAAKSPVYQNPYWKAEASTSAIE